MKKGMIESRLLKFIILVALLIFVFYLGKAILNAADIFLGA